ncbi:hypothetical protein BDA99DRAFT_534223 [Phascolomyces articulosus]|uniref:Chromatin target of PRMT1 protein C-terminal domain-containing protein n=1 Tax=Phascolomyces articulosus TaxID=60185 RepID=A0AAD5PGU1_9FUNG|nr:hypothetical protein BDA99DRAFT_534223 [Phascolomyces articulosus]
MAPRRVYNNNNNSGRVVTLGGNGGGLNERFSQLDQSKKPSSNGTGSVFSRIRGGNSNNNNAKPGRRNTSNIQNRLSRPASGGVRKRNGNHASTTSAMQGVVRSAAGNRNSNQRHGRPGLGNRRTTGHRVTQQQRNNNRGASSSSQQQRGGNRANNNNNQKGRNKNNNNNNKGKKPVTAKDLDKSLDDYMMKDPQTAQSRLDAELNSYMDESGDGDVLMDLNILNGYKNGVAMSNRKGMVSLYILLYKSMIYVQREYSIPNIVFFPAFSLPWQQIAFKYI